MSVIDDIRNAASFYVQTNVAVAIQNLKADIPNAISPGEGFTFDVTWKNNGTLQLTNIRLHIRAPEPLILQAPDNAYYGLSRDPQWKIPIGSLVQAMYLIPTGWDLPTLYPGETDRWLGIHGRANALGTGSLFVNIVADIDMTTIFPSNMMSPIASLPINIV